MPRYVRAAEYDDSSRRLMPPAACAILPMRANETLLPRHDVPEVPGRARPRMSSRRCSVTTEHGEIYFEAPNHVVDTKAMTAAPARRYCRVFFFRYERVARHSATPCSHSSKFHYYIYDIYLHLQKVTIMRR